MIWSTRLVHFFTFLNFLLIGAIPIVKDERYTDVVRGTTMLTVACVLSVWMSGKLFNVYDDMFVPIFPPMDIDLIYFFIICGDIIVHVVPFLFLGFPHHASSVLIAYTIILLWYIMMKDMLNQVYSVHINIKYSMVCIALVGAMVFLGLIRA